MQPVTLVPITAANFRECIRLKTQPEHESFVATNLFSIAEASVHPTWTPCAIAAGEILVGFVLIPFSLA
ncbi:MAG: hypothetical protein H0T53_14300 [Herpetosiphonaceae bacterium]|nr:hypothetical protein [Herpetosiphonaceae bacterium]